MIVRAVAVFLVLANLLYFAWSQNWLAAIGWTPQSMNEREPQRMAQQILPQVLQIKPEAPPPVNPRNAH